MATKKKTDIPEPIELDPAAIARPILKLIATRTDEPHRQLDQAQLLCANVLIEAINEYLRTPKHVLRAQESMTPPTLVDVVDRCKPTCPMLEYIKKGIDPDPWLMADCERAKAFKDIGEYPAWPWMLSQDESPWSYRWVCTQLGCDSQAILIAIQHLPKNKPLQLNGKRVYRHNHVSYDVSLNRGKKSVSRGVAKVAVAGSAFDLF